MDTITITVAENDPDVVVSATLNEEAVTITLVEAQDGAVGATGATGAGVAAGGIANDILKKTSSTNYATAWETPASTATANAIVRRDASGGAEFGDIIAGALYTTATGGEISTSGTNAYIYTDGANATIYTQGANANIEAQNSSASVKAWNFAALDATTGASLKNSAGTAVLTWGATAGNISITVNTTSTGHFFSNPGTSEAGHFLTKNGTTPTVAVGRSAWFSNASGAPQFKNGTGSAVTLIYDGGALGTPSSGTLTNCTGLPVTTGVSGLGANVAAFLATPTSANLAAALTDETGTGAAVFGTNPTLSGAIITDMDKNTLGRIAALTMSQSPPCSLFEDFCGSNGAGIFSWTSSGTGSDSTGTMGQRSFGVRRMTTGAILNNQRKTILPIPTASIFGIEIRAHFAIPDITTASFTLGMEQSSGEFGRYFLVYSSALNSGNWLLLTGTGAGSSNNFGTTGPANGDFASGKRYRTIMRVINATTVYVKIDEADYNLNNWTNKHDANLTITSYTPSTDPIALDIRINTLAVGARSFDIDYISAENTSITR
jgi:hypothetical protein